MQTQEPTKKQPAARNTSRNNLVAAGAFAVVIVIGLVAALLINNSDSGPVAAADAVPVVVFDGTTCSYDGPTQIEEGTVEFSTTNSADTPYALYGWLLSGDALADELERTPIGADMEATPLDPMPAGNAVLGWSTMPGDSQTMPWPLSTGTYLLDCKTENHVWRPAQIEVVAP